MQRATGPNTNTTNIITGTYTGNGADNRNINIGIDLNSKANGYVIVKSTYSDPAAHRTEYAQGDLTMSFINSADYANGIQTFNTTGFQVGSAVQTNRDTWLYRYIVLWSDP